MKKIEEIKKAAEAVKAAKVELERVSARVDELQRIEPPGVDHLIRHRQEILGALGMEENETDRARLSAIDGKILAAKQEASNIADMQAGIVQKRDAAQSALALAENRHRELLFPHLHAEAVALHDRYFKAAVELCHTFKQLCAIGELCKPHAVGFLLGNEHLSLSMPRFNLELSDTAQNVNNLMDEVQTMRSGDMAAIWQCVEQIQTELKTSGLTAN